MAPTLKLGAQDLSTYIRLHPDDHFDPYDAGGFLEPGFSDAPFAEGQPLVSLDAQNRQMAWPLYFKGAPGNGGYAATVEAESSLVSYWRLGESAGTTAADALGGHNGTYQGGYTLGQPGALTGDPDTAVLLNGTTGLVSIPDSAALRPTAGITLEFWVNPSVTGGENGGVSTYYSAGGIGVVLEVYNGGVLFRVTGLSPTNQLTGGTIPTGSWSHVVGTYDGANMRIYVNGVQVASAATTGSITYNTAGSSEVKLGSYGGTYFINGSIDECALYSQGLSAARVSAHYTAGTTAPTIQKDNLHALVRQINNEIANPTSRPLRVEWKDSGASNSTFYDVTFARFDPDFSYRLSEHGYAAGTLRVWCAPPYGHTATERLNASVAGTGGYQAVSFATSIAGDVDALIEVRAIAGSTVQDGHHLALAALPSSYEPLIPAASMVLGPSSTLVGAADGHASQAVIAAITKQTDPNIIGGQELVRAYLPAAASVYAGRNRVMAMVHARNAGPIALSAQDMHGRPLGATAMATALQTRGWQLVDLGVLDIRQTLGSAVATEGVVVRANLAGSGYYFPRRAQGYTASQPDVGITALMVFPEDKLMFVSDVNQRLVALEPTDWPALGPGTTKSTSPVGKFDLLGNVWATGYEPNGGAASPLQMVNGGMGATQAQNISSGYYGNVLQLARPETDMRIEVPWGGGAASDYFAVRKQPVSTYAVAHEVRFNNQPTGALSVIALPSTVLASTASIVWGGVPIAGFIIEAQFQGPAIRARLYEGRGGSKIMATDLVASAAQANAVGHPAVYIRVAPSSINSGSIDGVRVTVVPSRPLQAREFVTVNAIDRSAYRGDASNAYVENVRDRTIGNLKTPVAAARYAALHLPFPAGPANDPFNVEIRVRERFLYAR